jgi:hypothetical protein
VVLTRLSLGAAALLAACNSSGLVAGTAYDRPAEISGPLIGALPEGARPIVGVIWSDPFQRHPDVAMPTRWTASKVTPAMDGSGRAEVLLQLYRPPPQQALAEIVAPTGEVAEAAVGDVVIVDDGDGDGTFHVDDHGTLQVAETGGGDRYVAGMSAVLIYVARAFPGDVGATLPIGRLDKIGYQLTNLICEARRPTGNAPITTAHFEPLTSSALVERRTCLRTHSP